MNYKAHIPGALALAGGVAIASGMPLFLSYFIGAAIGGAAPDMDMDGSAVEKLGSKTGGVVKKAANKMDSKAAKGAAALFDLAAHGFDFLVLNPITTVWRKFASGPYSIIYNKLYNAFGKRLGWKYTSKGDVSGHRGGATHSLTFMFTLGLFCLPFVILLKGWMFLLGLEIGILAHLIADAFCVSGTKFFFPWKPAIGFKNYRNKPRGDDIRLVPVKFQMKTGAEQEFSKYKDDKSHPEYKERKHYAKMEKNYRRLFRLLALAAIICAILGVGNASGAIVVGNNMVPVGQAVKSLVTGQEMPKTTEIEQQSSQQLSTDNAQIKEARDAEKTSGFSDVFGTEQTVPETVGPTSLTYGDADISALPKGVYKMPDESLWITGIGPVNIDNLEKTNYTQAQKDFLLQASTASRVIPKTQKTEEQSQGQTSSGGGGLFDLLRSLFNFGNGVSASDMANQVTSTGGGEGIFGFHGLTSYTDTNENTAN